jgi:DNA-binding LytR/AlgR family response regulator
MAWQLLENVTIYGVLAVHAYWYSQRRAPGLVMGGEAETGGAPRALTRYFIRSGDDILPIDVGSIVSIAGADDYAEVSTRAGRHLVRMTLAQFETVLDPARFIRVHRSRLVNVEMIARAEPAGDGRILLHMEDGEMVQTSRTGAKRLRDHVL